jgi:hypothetical protein
MKIFAVVDFVMELREDNVEMYVITDFVMKLGDNILLWKSVYFNIDSVVKLEFTSWKFCNY